MKKERMKPRNLSLPPKLYNSMQSVAEEKGVSVSEIFRRAAEAYVASQNRIGGLIERY